MPDNPKTRIVYRFLGHLTRDTLVLILAGGRGTRLHELTALRAKPAVHFGGKYRIIDFPLSNCINSGIRKIAVLTQYKSHSLIRHLVRGWSHFKMELDEYIEILPASQQASDNWYQGTADAVNQNIGFIRETKAKYVMILSGDHIYKMDYRPMLLAHLEMGSDLTVSCLEVPIEEAAGEFGVMTVDDNNRIIQFDEKPQQPNPLPGKPDKTLASMGNYIFNTDFLLDILERDGKRPDSEHSRGPQCFRLSLFGPRNRRVSLLARCGLSGRLLGSQHGIDLARPGAQSLRSGLADLDLPEATGPGKVCL